MTAQTYFVGFDLILDDSDKGLKVLEMQSLFECDYPTAIKLTGKDPRVLIKSVKKEILLGIQTPKRALLCLAT